MARYDFYTLDNLNNIIERDGAELLENYKKVNKETKISFKCNCGNQEIKGIYYILNKSGALCKKCTTIIGRKKTKELWIKRYNVENIFQLKDIKEKSKKTVIKRYGVEHVSQTQEFKDKIKQTNIQRHGVENPMFSDEIKEKLKQTILNTYGVEHYSQTDEFKEKFKNTCLERYNVEHVSQTPEFREKVKQTFIENYNVDNPNKTEEIREKIRQTCINRYGVEHPSQSQEIQEKTQKNAKKFKEYKMPSGEVIKVQGYEPFALNELVKLYKEDDIITQRKEIPRIKYISNDKSKYYFPDIYIKSENKIIEVKSTWTYKCKTDNIKEKEEATKALGYDYEIWIYNRQGKKIEIPSIAI
jgi:hypothetical protein